MRECSVKELHECILEMLGFVDQVCKDNGIIYFLSGGSAIGAMRHNGFIPWDDDADIMMPRRDFEKFLAVTKDMEGCYRTGSLYGDYNWTFPFARIWDTQTKIEYDNLNEAATGIFIDIYPMDGLPNSKRMIKLHYKRVKFLFVCLNASIRKKFKSDEKHITLKRILGVLMRMVGAKRICRRIDRLARKRSFESAENVGCTVLCHYMERECFPRKDFEAMRYVRFEDTELPVPNGCEDYLTRLYGDYMQPPKGPIESEHHMHFYRL